MTCKENLLRTIRRQDPEWVPYRYDGSLTLLHPPVSVRPAEGGADDWGVRWIQTTSTEGSYIDGRPVITIPELDRFRPPNTDWEQVTTSLRNQVQEQRGKDTLLIAYNEMTLFDRAQALLATEEFLVAMVSCPEKVELLLDRIGAYQKLLTRAIMRSGVAGIRFTDDWGIQTSLFIPPELWRRLIKPRLKELYSIVKEHSGLVFQHSCGHISEIVPDLIELGLDVLDPCQPAANDIFQWKADFGNRFSFMGGLDTQGHLSFASPDEVRREVGKVLSLIAPMVRPRIRKREMMAARVTTGMTPIRLSAATFQNSRPLVVSAPAIDTGMVMDLLKPSTSTKMNSFHDKMKESTNTATRPRAARGRAIEAV